MDNSEQHESGVRALFAALATADSDETALARFAAVLADPGGDASGERLRRLWPPPASPADPTAALVADPPRRPVPPLRPRDPALERAIATASACVGRLESVDSGSVTPLATAWLVRPDLAVTIRKPLLPCLAQLTRGERTLQIDLPGDAPVAVREVVYVAPDCDLALLRVATRPSFIAFAPGVAHGHELAAIDCDDSPAPPHGEALPGGLRLVPGRVQEVSAALLRHDCAGRPGGVLLDLASAQAIGLTLGDHRSVPGWLVRERLERLNR
ncbi:hypothetical protein [Nannocystis punicea]|uniref:Uncharacterized protein n=1 Tax=Nannocystis punicea TaxID=2995304 RepID=A0ABY7GVR6_9BACT|nr:hypothetical protein [Nannocystis poenicansa]WAS91022.1 hypothetical protein O0S08_32945 [Nannocystis poenicansa]